MREWKLAKPDEYWVHEADKSLELGSTLTIKIVNWCTLSAKPCPLPDFPELDTFLFEGKLGYVVFEGAMGVALSPRFHDTAGFAIEAANKLLVDNGFLDRDKLRMNMRDFIDELGLSPRYRWEGEDEPEDDDLLTKIEELLRADK